MRIRTFCKNIEANEMQKWNLKNCSVVIDGQNYFYNLYELSGLPFQFGCESDKYADYLREHLSMYKMANVKCYIIFKGGHADGKKSLKNKEKLQSASTYDVSEPNHSMVMPVFMKRVYKEVLDEMGIDYVMCKFESKQQCIALAQKLKCPIISYDIEYAFSGVPYIPHVPSLYYDRQRRAIQCGIFRLGNFIQKHGITKEKLALFIVFTDEKIFPDQFFSHMFEEEGIPCLRPFRRNQELIKWLSRNTLQDILGKTYPILTSEEMQKFKEEYGKMLEFIDRTETPGEPVKYLLNGKTVSFEENDPCWFEKGVIADKVAAPYVNPYYTDTFYGSWSIEDIEAEDALFLSIDILKYAINLLTNYEKENIFFQNNKWEVQNVNVRLTNSKSVRKPLYEAQSSPFENGWDKLESLRLFDCFLEESLPDLCFISLTNIPKGARLLMLALVYFSRHKTSDVTREIYSILLSYIMLNVVFEKLYHNNTTCTKLESVVTKDCHTSSSIFAPFFELTRSELCTIFNRKLIHPFVEFQHCLDQINNLNKLCGQGTFEPTIYSKTYNGTFVYKVFYSLKNKSGRDALQTIKEMLTPAPSVLNIFIDLVKVYEQIMTSNEERDNFL